MAKRMGIEAQEAQQARANLARCRNCIAMMESQAISPTGMALLGDMHRQERELAVKADRLAKYLVDAV